DAVGSRADPHVVGANQAQERPQQAAIVLNHKYVNGRRIRVVARHWGRATHRTTADASRSIAPSFGLASNDRRDFGSRLCYGSPRCYAASSRAIKGIWATNPIRR